jgi:hypothetical protein
MVDVIRKHIVEKNNIPVIMTTHNPTTIASLDGIEIYEKIRTNPIPKKTTKEKALEILTEGIPFLTISTENRRAVFVESDYDVDIYSKLYEIFKKEISIQPHFFSCKANKNSGSNCEDVKKIQKSCNEANIHNVFGIIDGDNKAKSNGNLIVLGEGERYAIENFILDPLLVGLLLVIEGKNFSYFGLDDKDTPIPYIQEITETEAETIIDFISKKLGFSTDNQIGYAIIKEDWKLKCSKSLFTTQGHELEDLHKNKFPYELKKYSDDKQIEKNLKLKIINSVIKSYPKFAPKSLLDTLKKLK